MGVGSSIAKASNVAGRFYSIFRIMAGEAEVLLVTRLAGTAIVFHQVAMASITKKQSVVSGPFGQVTIEAVILFSVTVIAVVTVIINC